MLFVPPDGMRFEDGALLELMIEINVGMEVVVFEATENVDESDEFNFEGLSVREESVADKGKEE